MHTILVILYVLATLILLITILGMSWYHKIPFNGEFLISVAIMLAFITSSIYLIFHSFAFFILYGFIVSMLNVLFVVMSERSVRSGLISLLIGFIFWPQVLCFTIFALLHMNEILNDKH